MADNHVRGPALHALRRDAHVELATEVFGRRNVDEAVFAYAADRGFIVLSSDQDFLVIAHDWLRAGRMGFRMIFWKMELHAVMTDGEMVAGVWEIVNRPGAFSYPIEYLKKPRQ